MSKAKMHHARFVYIDDKPDPSVVEALGDQSVSVFHFPEDLTNRMEQLVSDIRDCSVIIVDLKLADHETDESGLNRLYPKDGLALKEVLASILTERVTQLDEGSGTTTVDVESRTTAFVLYSGELDLLGGGAPASGREHVLAKRIRAEWVMFKRPDRRPSLKVLEGLADAVELVIRPEWNELSEREEILSAIAELLSLNPNAPWAAVAQRHIFENRPPLQSLAEDDGISLIRWMLQLVLPYPSFLLDSTEVSLLCRVQCDWGSKQLNDPDTPIAKLFNDARYGGMLSSFLGPRWWRAGVLSILRTLTDGSPHNAESLKSKFGTMYQGAAPTLDIATPVRTVDEEFRLTTHVVDVEDAVRLEPEEWPPEMSPPWIPLSAIAQAPRLRRYVVERDIDRVQSYLTSATDVAG